MQQVLTDEQRLLERLREFALAFAPELRPDVSQEELDLAFTRALLAMSVQEQQHAPSPQLVLRFTHECRYIACSSGSCSLCRHNPHKRCARSDDLDDAYADGQVLRPRCGAELWVELVDAGSGQGLPLSGVEVQLHLIDGDAYNAAAQDPVSTMVTLRQNDNGVVMLQVAGAGKQSSGGVSTLLQDGRGRVPDVCVADKNGTSKFGGAATGRFALMGVAMQRGSGGGGQLAPLEGLLPVVSPPFAVKTQRAITDFHKPSHPHYQDKMTQLRHVGGVTAEKLKHARTVLGPHVPLECVETVEDLKTLVAYAETDRQVQDKLVRMLNMSGRSRHQWEALRRALAEAVVYDDAAPRLWLQCRDGSGHHGLMYHARQAQVQLDKPAGLARLVVLQDGSSHVQAMALPDLRDPQVTALALAAADAWQQPGHPGWQLLTEPVEWVASWAQAPPIPLTRSMGLLDTTAGAAGMLPALVVP